MKNNGAVQSTQAAAKKLPQTGDKSASALVALSLGSVAAMLGLTGKKRKQD